MFANIAWPPKLANIPPCYIFSIQTIDANCTFSNSLAMLANMVQGKTSWQTYSPQIRGADELLFL